VAEPATARIFDVGINDRLPLSQLIVLGLQNIFGMTGMFVFPGLLGRAFNLPASQIAYLYGMSFIVCGVITILQSVLLLRLPIIQGPYAGNFAALLAVGHLQRGGLGAAYGSFFIASLIWCVLTVPIGGWSFIGLFARFLRAPVISGMIVILTITQIANVALPNWIGNPASAGFPLVNLFAGAIAAAIVIVVSLWGGARLRRSAILAGLAAGTAFYAAFRPISFASVAAAPWLVEPRWFPFGFSANTGLVIVFLLVRWLCIRWWRIGEAKSCRRIGCRRVSSGWRWDRYWPGSSEASARLCIRTTWACFVRRGWVRVTRRWRPAPY
jgi:xanthine/uracil permease